MEKITIYKNKGEQFECQFKVDGADIEATSIRLCLEFNNNKNMFFYGSLKHDGTCTIDIPTLKELSNQDGKMVIEAIADSTYFRLYEAEVEIKNSVEVSVIKKPNVAEVKKTNIQLEQITPKKVSKPKTEQKSEVPQNDGWEPAQVEKKGYQPMSSVAESVTETSKLTRFDDFLKKKRS